MKQILSLLLAFFVFGSSLTFAQITTAAINGIVTDPKGEALPGATVVAIHEPSGTKYAITTRSDGRYSFSNVGVGGPYSISVTFVGSKTEKAQNIFLSLGQKFTQNFKLVDETAALQEVVVKANSVLNGTRTGAATDINNAQLQTMPTISRSQADYLRLNPMVAEGGSIAGRNPQFNNYSLDGAIFNNPFGLDAATPGGQSNAQPVSIDAIEQISVQVAPFDVTQSGLTGGSVNAVTKSGTNTISGTVFGFYRDQNLVGRNVKDITLPKADLSETQFGFSLGGPLIKDKLFFFLNAESDKRSDLATSWVAAGSGVTGSNVSRVQAADLQTVSSLLKSKFGYDTGPYQGYLFQTNSQKLIAKIDWNISDKHKLSFTYNYLDAYKDNNAHPSAIGRRGPDFLTLQFQNSGYRIHNQINGGIVELKSQFSNKIANKLQAGYTYFNDFRDPFSTPFPSVNIDKDGVRYIVAGFEPFSIHNTLTQGVFQITDNFNMYAGKHTFTFGGHFERFNFDNSFNLGAYAGAFGDYASLQDFTTAVNNGTFGKDVQAAQATATANKWSLAQTSIGQLSFYAQDEWTPNSKLTVTYGLRIDNPMYFDTQTKIQESIASNCCYDATVQYYDAAGSPIKLSSTTLPSSAPLFSPRMSFNYDAKGDRTQQLRGGTGIFTGRLPFVWIGNQVADVNTYFYCTTDPNFKFPQVWRTNIGYDQQFKNGWLLSLDLIYTKDIHAPVVLNYGIKTPTGKLQGVDNRPIYTASDVGANDAYVFSNTSAGYSFNASFQAEKTWANGLFTKFGYNYLNAQDAYSIAAEISSDAFNRNPANIQNSNQPTLAPSLYGNRNRFFGVAGKKFVEGKAMATVVSLFAEYVEGGRYSYTYNGDINNDSPGGNGNLNDLMFIPTDAQIDQMKFSGDATSQAAQRAGLKTYIANDNYLSSRRGQYAEKNGALAPWYSEWDLKLLQEFKLSNKNRIEFSVDMLNFGNLLNKNWGVRQWAGNTSLAQPLGVTVTNSVPTYSFDTSQTSAIQPRLDNLVSQWRMQFGLRYRF